MRGTTTSIQFLDELLGREIHRFSVIASLIRLLDDKHSVFMFIIVQSLGSFISTRFAFVRLNSEMNK